jgi:hypothetical protein
VVRFYVNAEGRVDRVETIPEITDGRYRRLMQELLLDYRFKPARDSLGVAVAGISSGEVTLPNH